MMKGLVVLSTLIGVVLSTTIIDQCVTDRCESDFDGGNGVPILLKSRHNVSKVTNVTRRTKNVRYVAVEGDGNIRLDTNEEAGT